MRHQTLEHRFVKHVPDKLEPGILYVSMEYGSVVHACCCGCGEEVVTPLTPTDWKLIFDGVSVSLRPSVGSWTLPCRSHYIIDSNRVVVAEPWSDQQIEAERARDRTAKSRQYNVETEVSLERRDNPDGSDETITKARSWYSRLWKRILDG